MNQNKLFEITQQEIKEFRAFLDAKLDERNAEVAHAIDRNDAWGEIATHAANDAEDPAFSDITDELEEFSQSMKESEEAWES